MARRKSKIPDDYQVCRDHQGCTCIRVEVTEAQIRFIPMDIDEGFQVFETSPESFNQRYHLLSGYPLERACQLYLKFCTATGASDEVLNHLSKVINVTSEEREMATSKRKAQAETKKSAPKAAKPTTKRTRTVKAPAKKPDSTTKRKVKAAVKKVKGTYTSASQMFQALIMEGKKTDDEIFAAVQAEFGLDDKKRGYVSWYRNHLRKQGQNPPEPVK